MYAGPDLSVLMSHPEAGRVDRLLLAGTAGDLTPAWIPS
jgi:hypothetical protein